MKRMIAAIGLVACIAFSAAAEQTTRVTLSISEVARHALARSRVVMIRSVSAPTTVAGTRGARFAPEELYWKSAGPTGNVPAPAADKTPEVLIIEAEAFEASDSIAEAAALYRKILVEGCGGRIAMRAGIGLATCRLEAGETLQAVKSLRGIAARALASNDAEMKFAATLPLAVGLSAQGDNSSKAEAVDVLKKLLAAYPDNACSGQADSMLWFLTSAQ